MDVSYITDRNGVRCQRDPQPFDAYAQQLIDLTMKWDYIMRSVAVTVVESQILVANPFRICFEIWPADLPTFSGTSVPGSGGSFNNNWTQVKVGNAGNKKGQSGNGIPLFPCCGSIKKCITTDGPASTQDWFFTATGNRQIVIAETIYFGNPER